MDRRHKLKHAQRGISLTELMVALFASTIVLFALGNIVLTNQRFAARSQSRASLQSYTTVVMSRMARAIRGAHRVEVTGNNAFRLRDLNGAVTTTIQLVDGTDGPRLQYDGDDMAEIDCSRFTVRANGDTTSLTLDLEFTTDDGLVLSALNTVSIRNRTLEY